MKIKYVVRVSKPNGYTATKVFYTYEEAQKYAKENGPDNCLLMNEKGEYITEKL